MVMFLKSSRLGPQVTMEIHMSVCPWKQTEISALIFYTHVCNEYEKLQTSSFYLLEPTPGTRLIIHTGGIFLSISHGWCISYFFIAVMKHCNQGNLKKEGLGPVILLEG